MSGAPTGTRLERKLRGRLRLLRLLPAYLPLSISGPLMKAGVARVRLPAGVTRRPVNADGVACEWLIPEGSRQDAALLYLHGGGFVYGLTPQHLQMVAYLAGKLAMPALMVDYRLAPEHPFPAALDDCVTAYRWLLEQGIPSDAIAIAGDSAGGNLTMTTMMRLRDSGDPLPAAAACLSPVTDLCPERPASRVTRDPLLHPRAMKMFDACYLSGHDPHDPSISPVLGDWSELSPLLVHAGEDEILREDTERAVLAAQAAGVDAEARIFPRMWHVWQLFLQLPQAAASLDEISRFLSSRMLP